MLKKKKSAPIIITLLFVVITAAMAFVGLMSKNNWDFSSIKFPSFVQTVAPPSEETSSETSSEIPQYILPETMSTQAGTFNTPSEMRAVFLQAGEDFYKTESDTIQTVKKDIETAVEKAKEFSLNTVVVLTDFNGKTLYNSPYAESHDLQFDALDYILKTARANQMYVYAVLSPSHVIDENGKTAYPNETSSKTLKKIYDRFYHFAQNYNVDGILLKDYYYTPSDDAYLKYTSLGYNMGYSNYQEYVCETQITTAATAIRHANNNIQICLYADGVWQNAETDERGSNTTADFQALTDGRADTKKFIEKGMVDAVFVEALGSLTAYTIPFENIVSWWDECTKVSNTTMYIIHAATKVGSSSTGWTLTDQLTRQLITAKKYTQYSGSCFNSLASLIENKGGSTTALVSYYNNEVSDDLILKNLAVTKPSKTNFTTTEPYVQFAGASAPAFDLLFNGEKVERDETGFFSMVVELKPGKNTFTLEHKGKVTTYTIERKVEVLKEISPTGSIAVDGGDKITVSALAYKDSKVTATLSKTTVTLQVSDEQTDATDNNSDYQLYTATITAPEATSKDQNLGSITINATWEGYSGSATGASVKVNKKAVVGNGQMIKVTAKEAETFPTGVLNDYSHPDYFPLPAGTIDRILGSELTYIEAGVTYKYYKLESGVRVYSKDVTSITETTLADNKISGITVSANNTTTKVIFKTALKVPFVVNYTGSALTIDFKYTTSVPASMTLNKNPLFSSATWSGSKLTLKLQKNGAFLGFNSYYDNGELVLKFNNPILMQSASNSYGYTLNGTKIAIDSGHGGSSNPGAVGVHPSYPESRINQAITGYLKTMLEEVGATVYLIDSVTTDPSLASRVNQAKSFGAHLMISVHQNSALSSTASGTEAFYFNEYSRLLATKVASLVSSAIPTNNRGAKFGYYYVTRDTQFPGILLEAGFISNSSEHYALMQDSTQQAIAKAVINAIIAYGKETGGASSFATGTQSSGEASNVVENVSPSLSSSQNVSVKLTNSSAESTITVNLGEGAHKASSVTAKLASGDETGATVGAVQMGDSSATIKVTFTKKGTYTVNVKAASEGTALDKTITFIVTETESESSEPPVSSEPPEEDKEPEILTPDTVEVALIEGITIIDLSLGGGNLKVERVEFSQCEGFLATNVLGEKIPLVLQKQGTYTVTVSLYGKNDTLLKQKNITFIIT